MQYKVPQNVDIEDKVIGPLTVRQFIILLVAVGIILVLNFILVGPLRMIFYLVALTVGGLASIIAFVKYGDQNFEVFLLSAYKTFISPRKRIWKKENKAPQKETIIKPKENTEQPKTKKSIEEAKNDLSKLAEIVDSGGYISTTNGERKSNIDTPTKNTATDAKDFLVQAEEPNNKIDTIIEKVSKSTPKRDPLVSEVASVDPSKKLETPKIKLRGEEFK